MNFYGDANTSWNKIVFSQTSNESSFEVDNLTSRIFTFDYALDDIDKVGNIVVEMSGTTTTASDVETSTWDFCSANVTENCSNGIDDNNDGLIDCGDTDCYGDDDCEDTFECTSTLYQVISTTLKELNITKSSYNDIGVAAEHYNGGGFNYQERYIYGIYNNSVSNKKN